MTATGTQLLGLLGSGVRPAGPARAVDALRTGEADRAGGPSFAGLLERAKRGEIGSGLPVEIDAATGLELSDEQMGRLAQAADLATAQGAERAVVLMDGRALVLDVASRRVIESHMIEEVSALPGIDAVVGAPAANESVAPVGLDPLTAPPAWLARVLDAGAGVGR